MEEDHYSHYFLDTDSSSMSMEETEDEDTHRIPRGMLNEAGLSMLLTLQQRTLLPQIENIKRFIATRDDMQLLVQLHHTCDFLLTFTETFADVAPSEQNDFCGLGSILVDILEDEFEIPEINVSALRCMKVIVDNSRESARKIVDSHILSKLVSSLENIEFIDLAEVTLELINCFAKRFPQKCLEVGAVPAMLAHLDFFPRATQLSVLRAVGRIVTQATKDTFSARIAERLMELLRASTEDPALLHELLKIYEILLEGGCCISCANNADELFAILRAICHNYKDINTWSIAFKLLTSLTLYVELCDADDVLELGFAQLEARIHGINGSLDGTENFVVSILETMLPILFPDVQELLRLPVEVPVDHHESIIIYLSRRKQVILRKVERDHQFKVSPAKLQVLLRLLDEVYLNLSFARETKILCMICLYGACLLCSDEPFEYQDGVRCAMEDFYSVMTMRTGTLSLLALISFAIITERIPLIKDFLGDIIDQRDNDWDVGQEQVNAFKRSLTWGLVTLYPEIRSGRATTMDELAEMLEDAVVSSVSNKKAHSLCEASVSRLLKALDDSEGQQTVENSVSAPALLTTHSSDLLRSIKNVQRYLSQHDRCYANLIMEQSRASQHPLESLVLVARPVKVSFSAEIQGRRPIRARLLTVDAFVSPMDIYSSLLERESRVNESFNVDVSVDMSDAGPPSDIIDWNEYSCSVKFGDYILESMSTMRSILTYPLLNQSSIENLRNNVPFSTLLAPLFSEVVEIKLWHGRRPPTIYPPVELPHSPTDESVKMCLEGIKLASLKFSHEAEIQSALINGRLTRKMKKQLWQVLLVTAGYIPCVWRDLMRSFSFMFDFETKIDFLVATQFGTPRYLERIQGRYKAETGIDPSDSIVRLARIGRVKITVDRDRFDVESQNAMNWYATDKRHVLEFQFANDVGVGLGPTLEFYSMLSRNLQRCENMMWLSETDKGEVVWKTGLYPSPMAKKEDFAFLGSLIARAILDQRLVDLYLNEIFVDVLLDRNPAPSLRTLASIDPVLSQTLSSLKKAPLNAFADLYFTHPGSTQIELLPNGAQLRVTPDNYDEFLDSLLRLIIDTSLGELKRAFIDAFDKILPWEAFRILSSEEFNRLINGERGLQWDSQSILHTIRADHGYSQRSPQVLWLTEVFSELDSAHKTRLIQFLTGASQLPSGGWANLRPALTVVCRSSDDPDQSLPTVMTCANYLKLPRYSSKEILRDKLLVAIEEGGGSFLLS